MHYTIADEDWHCMLMRKEHMAWASGRRQCSVMLFKLIFLPKLIHAAARIACDSGPTCQNLFRYTQTDI